MSSRFFPNKDLGVCNGISSMQSRSIPITQILRNENEEALVSAYTSNLSSAATSSSSVKSKKSYAKLTEANFQHNHNTKSAHPSTLSSSMNYANCQNHMTSPHFYSNNNYYSIPCFTNIPPNYGSAYGHSIPIFYPPPIVIKPLQPNFLKINQYFNNAYLPNYYIPVQRPITSYVSKETALEMQCSPHLIPNSKESSSTFSQSAKTNKATETIVAYENVDEFIENCKDIVDYANTLKGSRHLQKLLAKEESKAFPLFLFIVQNLHQLLTNVYGNYVCKKIFSLLKQSQRQVAWEYLQQDIKFYSENQHANHSVQMLITQSESDSEKQAIELKLSYFYKYIAFNEHGINVLFAILAIVNYQSKEVLIIKFINDFLLDLTRDANAITLCSAIITRLASENCLKLHKQNFLKKLKPIIHDLIMNETSSSLLLQLLEEWGLADCDSVINTLSNNFTYYAKHSSSSLIMVKFLELLESFVSININFQLEYYSI